MMRKLAAFAGAALSAAFAIFAAEGWLPPETESSPREYTYPPDIPVQLGSDGAWHGYNPETGAYDAPFAPPTDEGIAALDAMATSVILYEELNTGIAALSNELAQAMEDWAGATNKCDCESEGKWAPREHEHTGYASVESLNTERIAREQLAITENMHYSDLSRTIALLHLHDLDDPDENPEYEDMYAVISNAVEALKGDLLVDSSNMVETAKSDILESLDAATNSVISYVDGEIEKCATDEELTALKVLLEGEMDTKIAEHAKTPHGCDPDCPHGGGGEGGGGSLTNYYTRAQTDARIDEKIAAHHNSCDHAGQGVGGGCTCEGCGGGEGGGQREEEDPVFTAWRDTTYKTLADLVNSHEEEITALQGRLSTLESMFWDVFGPDGGGGSYVDPPANPPGGLIGVAAAGVASL